jgi:hypothetical protein
MVKLPPLKNKDYSDLKHHHQNTWFLLCHLHLHSTTKNQ